MKEDSKAASKKGKASLIDDEQRATGQVGLHVYWLYATKAFRGFHFIVLILLQTCWQGLQIASDYYLAHSTADQAHFQPTRFITTYSELAFGSGFFVLLRSLLVAFAGLMTAQSFFVTLLGCIIRAPMSFFDTTPSGRILTRVWWPSQRLLVWSTLQVNPSAGSILYGKSWKHGQIMNVSLKSVSCLVGNASFGKLRTWFEIFLC